MNNNSFIHKLSLLKKWIFENPNVSIPLIVMASIGIISIIVSIVIALCSTNSASQSTQKTYTDTKYKNFNEILREHNRKP